ncbi:MAG: hypothetical protein KJ072_19900 [Verrucomicrobia bacterium]|nr:hypothetical protein [Verrucomicrobiota bacterium]
MTQLNLPSIALVRRVLLLIVWTATPLQAAVQSVPVPERTLTLSCAPPHWLVIQGEPIPAGEIRGRIYLVPNDVPALLARYARDFPEHQSPPRAADRPATSLANPEVHYTVPVLPYTVLRRGDLEAVVVDKGATWMLILDDSDATGTSRGCRYVAHYSIRS